MPPARPSSTSPRAAGGPLVTVLATVLALLSVVGVAAPAAADSDADGVFAQTNEERAARGLPRLARDPTLDAAATAWARHMADTGTFAHSTNTWRQTQARPGWTMCCAENIAAGYTSATSVTTAWMGSSGHRANILGSASAIGVGHVYVAGSAYGDYWVQIFATYPFDRAANEAFVRALYRDFLGRSAQASEVQYWTDRLAAGSSRASVTKSLATSKEWVASVITAYYEDTLGRAPDAAGLAYWVDLARAGRPIERIAADFYASPEYVARVGGSSQAWVRDLYPTLLDRGPDGAGVAHWLDKLASGTSRSDVALGFYQSDESCRARVEALYEKLLDRSADAVGLQSWPPKIRANGDLALASSLAASTEYFTRAQAG